MSSEATAGGKTRFRVTVDYGDDRIRTYAVTAKDAFEASDSALKYANSMLTVDATDEWDEWDVEPDYEWDAEDDQDGALIRPDRCGSNNERRQGE